MGQAHSEEAQARNVSTEQLSHELALRFAKTCFSPLELTHFKDIFRSLADQQDGVQYWKEETLCRFLNLPDSLNSGSLIYQMTSYLGAFPFPSLAPSILTIDAVLKVVVIMTERYGKVLKRGVRDRNKLLFRSLAVFDRRMSFVSEKLQQQNLNTVKDESNESKVHQVGPTADQPENDEDEDEDDDELALAALDSLDAIEVFKLDQRPDTKIHHAQIPLDNFQRLVMLLLVIAPLGSQENLAKCAESLTESKINELRSIADSVLWSFAPEENAGIFYRSFNVIVSNSLPFLFDGLTPLFEHFLFSKNIDLSRRKRTSSLANTSQPIAGAVEILPEPLLVREGEILNLNILSQLSFFLRGSSIFRRLRPLYLAGEAGFSIGSFEQKVFNWRAPTILLVSGSRLPQVPQGSRERTFADHLPPKRFSHGASGNSTTGKVIYGAYIDKPWKHTNKEAFGGCETLLFQLEPIHEVFRASAMSTDYVNCTKLGISIGCPPPRSKSVSGLLSQFILGAVSLLLDEALEYGVFTHDSDGGGSFYPSQTRKKNWQDRFEIDSLEVWGCGGDEEAEKQRSAWAFEAREAEARKNLKIGKDIEADRALLEMAGLMGAHNASGGSMG